MPIQPNEVPNNLCKMGHFPKPKQTESPAAGRRLPGRVVCAPNASTRHATAATPTIRSLPPRHTRLATRRLLDSIRHRGPPPAEKPDRTGSSYATRSDIAAPSVPSTAGRHSEILGRRSSPQLGHSPHTESSHPRPTPYCVAGWPRDSLNTQRTAGLPHRPWTNAAAGQPGSPPASPPESSTARTTRKSQTPTVDARSAGGSAGLFAEESLPCLFLAPRIGNATRSARDYRTPPS